MESFPEGSPFADLSISSHDPLREFDGKGLCTQCGHTMKFYCYDCLVPSPALHGQLPHGLSLPTHVLLWKHPSERSSKATGLQSKILAPSDVTVIARHPSEAGGEGDSLIAPYEPSRTLLLYPCDDAQPINVVDPASYDALVVIEATWQQSRAMVNTLRRTHAAIRPVTLSARIETKFWRHQDVGPHCLATIEAIYYALRDIGEKKDMRTSRLDDLLWFYSYQFHLIQQFYRSHPERSFTRKHREHYIDYKEDKK